MSSIELFNQTLISIGNSYVSTAKPTLHLFAPLSPSPYRTIKTRARKPTCSTCGTLPLTSSSPSDNIEAGSTPQSRWKDFIESNDGEWPGWEDPLCSLPGVGEDTDEKRSDERLRVRELKETMGENVRIVDTRPETEFGIVNLDGSISTSRSLLLLFA